MTANALKLLLIENDADDRQRIRRLLGGEFDVIEAATFAQGSEQIAASSPSCVVASGLSPPVDDAATAFLGELKRGRTPVVLLTEPVAAVLPLAPQTGACDCLPKSDLNRTSLNRSIRFAVERRKSEEATRQAKRLQAEIEESAWLRERALAAATEGIIIADAQQDDLPVIYVNAAFESITGYKADEAIGRNCRFLQGEKTDSETVERIRTALQNGKACQETILNYRKSGEPFWNRLAISPVRDAEGRITHFVGVQSDVTLQMNITEALRLHSKAVQHSAASIIMTDRDGVIEYVNPRFTEMTGYRQSEVRGKKTSILKSGVHPPAFYKEIWDAILAGEVWHGEFCNRRKSGELYWERGSISPVRDSFGQITHFVAVKEDVTQWKRFQHLLQEKQDRFDALASSAHLMVCELDVDSKFVYVSPNFEKLLGWRPDELVDTDPIELAHHEDIEQMRLQIRTAFETGNSHATLRILHRDGQWRWIECHAIAYETAERQPRILVTGRDITAKVCMDDRLLHSQKLELVGQLAGGIAHDFNNLMTVVQGFTCFALNGTLTEDQTRDLAQVKAASERAADLTRQLLAFSRRQPLQPVVVDLNELIGNASRILQRMIGEQVRLVFEPADELWRIRVDPGQLEQILFNLAINARDAMSAGGVLKIVTDNVRVADPKGLCGEIPAGRYVRFTVSDNGFGMDAQTRDRIFEPFFSTKGLGKGTGLGLSTVYGIVRQHAGHIAVQSEPGKGTNFSVYLPTCETEGKSLLGDAKIDPALCEGRETILLVEDDDDVRRMLERVLNECGYNVLSASLPSEALILVADHGEEIDLLLTDVVMPQMSGKELYDEIVSRVNLTKVLFVSGYADDAIAEHGVVKRDFPFLPKPFEPTVLAMKLREVIDGQSPAASTLQ